MPAITHQTMTVLFCLQSDNDRAVTPTIYQPTDRRALCLTSIITAAGTVLPPEQTAAPACSYPELTIAALPAAYPNLTVAAMPTAYRYLAAPACS